MINSDQSSLQDIYSSLSLDEQPQQASYMYMSQFMWPDFSPRFNVVGPYCSSFEYPKNKICSYLCVWNHHEAIWLYRFQTSVLVCDSARANALLETSTGVSGTYRYGAGATTEQKGRVFLRQSLKIHLIHPIHGYWVIFPSHLVSANFLFCSCKQTLLFFSGENTINALFSFWFCGAITSCFVAFTLVGQIFR